MIKTSSRDDHVSMEDYALMFANMHVNAARISQDPRDDPAASPDACLSIMNELRHRTPWSCFRNRTFTGGTEREEGQSVRYLVEAQVILNGVRGVEYDPLCSDDQDKAIKGLRRENKSQQTGS